MSNFEVAGDLGDLPKIGDYQTINWEKMIEAQPTHVIVQAEPSRLPDGLQARLDDEGIELVIVKLNRVSDVTDTLDVWGKKFNASAASQKSIESINTGLEGVEAKVVSKRPTVLLSVSTDGKFAAGRETFLDDLLLRVGGQNVLDQKDYASLEEERLLELNPSTIIVFAPSATPMQLDAIRASWDRRESLTAVKEKRVRYITRADAMMPGPQVAELAAEIGKALRE